MPAPSSPVHTDPSTGRAAPTPRPPRRRRRPLVLMATMLVALALVGAACYQLDENNRANPIYGASNGQLGSSRLVSVSPNCSVYWEIAESMRQLISAAAYVGVTITPSSCYRDYAGQVAARDYWCALGACHMAAVPGTSNHGWGKAVDFREGSRSMTYDSPGYAWMVANAGLFGWIQPKGMKEGGPVPEPWHWEWIGDGGKMFPGQYFGFGNALPLSGSPIGNFEAVWPTEGGFRVLGWALDPDQQSPVDIHVYIGPWWGGSHVADTPRPDVGAAYPAYSSQPHGFDETIRADPGVWNVCVYPIDKVAPGTNVLLGCRTVTVPPPAAPAAVEPPPPTTVPSSTTTTVASAPSTTAAAPVA